MHITAETCGGLQCWILWGESVSLSLARGVEHQEHVIRHPKDIGNNCQFSCITPLHRSAGLLSDFWGVVIWEWRKNSSSWCNDEEGEKFLSFSRILTRKSEKLERKKIGAKLLLLFFFAPKWKIMLCEKLLWLWWKTEKEINRASALRVRKCSKGVI